jgi:hypothetical protein
VIQVYVWMMPEESQEFGLAQGLDDIVEFPGKQ